MIERSEGLRWDVSWRATCYSFSLLEVLKDFCKDSSKLENEGYEIIGR